VLMRVQSVVPSDSDQNFTIGGLHRMPALGGSQHAVSGNLLSFPRLSERGVSQPPKLPFDSFHARSPFLPGADLEQPIRGLSQLRLEGAARAATTASAIENAIVRSRWLLELKEGWDEEGSPSIDKSTWEVAASFLRRQAHHFTIIPVPHIMPGSDGSIDIHWKTERFELLVNISKGPVFVVSFYGDDYGRSKIEGELDPTSESAYLPLISWLLEERPGP